MVRRAASIVHTKDTYYVQFSFDGHPDVDDQLREMVHHWHLKPASTQFSQYGAWTRYFTLRFPRTLIKPQEPLRPSVPGQHILDAVPGGRGNDERAAAGQALAGRPPTSVDWDGGIVYSRTKSGTKYPDFLISSYYGLKEPGGQELEREVPRLVVEVGSLRPDEVIPTIDDRIAILKQLQSYMARVVAHVDLRKHELPWGLAIIGTYAAWLRPSRRNAQCAWEYIGGFHSGRGYWTSIYGLEFRKYIDERADKCRLDSIAYARAYREKLDNLQNAPPEVILPA
ncbi:uncharacterized protein B0H18DRAFT_1128838 [Fomitopsis serialis]|uniref:uncharacterized protein n=1 Tax=Fomitopsis serialis TaxID=139415 RepID=UPI00200899A1|nr:uncharacterized protein B0H18DRAFT_1128838 [Neoantrodia serialis]KAH9911349.1 hypothetical protein B0H18DRAFT_1128838 [Neoantrodia serialis]